MNKRSKFDDRKKIQEGTSLEKLFHLKEHGTNFRTEIIAGLTTFFTMAYIIFLNPTVIGQSNPAFAATGYEGAMPDSAVFTATCFGAAIGTWLIGWLSNYPMAQAPGLGLNAVFAYTLCIGFGLSPSASLAAVFLGGVAFILLTVTGARKAIVNSIPRSMKKAISAGIGLFIALIGFADAGIVIGQKAGAATPVDLASFTEPSVILALVGLILMTILVIQKVPGAIFIGLIIISIIANICQFAFGIEMGVSLPQSWVPNIDFSMFGKCFVGFGELFSAPFASIFAVMITLLMVDMFDTIGTLIGAADKAGYLDEHGNLPKIEKAMLADALATTIGAVFGTSTVSTYVESTAGIAAGGRTGLTSTVTGLCFAFALVLSPLLGFVPTAATAPILIIVGIMMCSSLKDIEWDDLETAFPCFFTVVGMPFFYSITDGIAFGFISFIIVKVARGKFREVKPLMYIISLMFIMMYVITGLQALQII